MIFSAKLHFNSFSLSSDKKTFESLVLTFDGAFKYKL